MSLVRLTTLTDPPICCERGLAATLRFTRKISAGLPLIHLTLGPRPVGFPKKHERLTIKRRKSLILELWPREERERAGTIFATHAVKRGPTSWGAR